MGKEKNLSKTESFFFTLDFGDFLWAIKENSQFKLKG